MIPEEHAEAMQRAVDGDVQTAYGQYLKGCDILSIASLRDNTHVQPQLREEDVQAAYGKHFTKSLFAAAKLLRELTGIGPSEQTVQEGYRISFEGAYYTDVRDLKELTGIAPIMDESMEKAVQKGYERCVNFSNCAAIAKKMKNLSNIAPSENLLKKHPKLAEALK